MQEEKNFRAENSTQKKSSKSKISPKKNFRPKKLLGGKNLTGSLFHPHGFSTHVCFFFTFLGEGGGMEEDEKNLFKKNSERAGYKFPRVSLPPFFI